MKKLNQLYHRLTHYEYWPFWAFYLPVFILWPILSLRGRSILFFTAANPCIPHGGSFGESKIEILGLIDENYKPATFNIEGTLSLNAVETWMKNKSLSFPIVAKPDVGERGDNIELIRSLPQLADYTIKLNRPFLLQEYINTDFEAGVMVIKNIHTGKFEISSIVTKDYLQVTGDGVSTVEELMNQSHRASFQVDRFREMNQFHTIIPKGKTLVIEPIGNHKRGTTFINGNHLLTEVLTKHFDEMSQTIQGFSFGRYDVKSTSETDFKQGLGIKVMELNGAFSEPGHIYDPKETLLMAWKDLVIHWFKLAEISGYNAKHGVRPTGFFEFANLFFQYRNLNQTKVIV